MHLSLLATAVTAAAITLPLVSAFSDTTPFLAYTSRQSSLLDRGLTLRSIGSPAVAPQDIARSLTSKGQELCTLDAIVLVEVENLHSHSFQALPEDSYLRSRALDAPSQIAFPHVSLNHGDAISEVRNAVQRKCQKAWGGKDIIKTLRLKGLEDEALSKLLSDLNQDSPNHLIVVTSATRNLQMRKRTLLANDTDSVMDPKLGLLHRYQFFSTGLLTALLVMVLLLIPAVYFAVGLLSSIETPDRLGERVRSNGDKKSQ